MIAAAMADGDRARALLTEALKIDPAFDLLGAARAGEILTELP